MSAGNYTITAKAYDNSGAATTSAGVTVRVVTVASDQCAGISLYVENAGYAAGSKVKNTGKRYECKEFPYSGWCNGAAWAYAPGTGAYWSDAWYDRGSCSAREGEMQAEDNKENVLSIVPNPVSDVMTIQLNEPTVICIYNSQGLEVMSSTRIEAQAQIQLNHLASGIYIMKIDTEGKVVMKTFVKN